ncbi:MAG: GNAT family N-acetyltransferase [Planctomycetota bacterium]
MRRELESGLVLCSTAAEHAEALEELQEIVFPTLSADERFRAEHYLKHIELFPEGQFVVLDGERVVGMTSTLRLDFDLEHANHTFAEVIEGGYLTSHDPTGRWLYGADMGTHPDYRRRGIARALYAARQEVVRALGLAGQVTVGMLSGYGARSGELSLREYYERVASGEISDPTVSTQRRMGFEPRGLVEDYLDDPVCGNGGALLVLDAGVDLTL